MSNAKKAVFEGVSVRALSKHLRANGVKVTGDGKQGDLDVLFLRTNKSTMDILALAKQVPHQLLMIQEHGAA